MTKGCNLGVTLVEILLAVAIISVLAAFLIPSVNLAVRSRQNAECARKLCAAVEAFELYAEDKGGYPPNGQPGVIPPEMADYYFPYFKIDWWDAGTELGGSWDWNVNENGIRFSVSINTPAKSQTQMEELDRLVDDGNLATGRFRKAGMQYHYVIEN